MFLKKISLLTLCLSVVLAGNGLSSCGYGWKADEDGDGDGVVTMDGDCWDAEEGPEGSDLSGAEINPYADETYYDGIDQNCDGLNDYDADGDGFDSSDYEGEDCDDTNAEINPDATEVCDGVDNNCDGLVDSGASDTDGMTPYYADADGDGYAGSDSEIAGYTCGEAPAGFSTDNSDCDDTNSAINPGASEICDEVDNDCNTEIDNDPTDGTTYYEDKDLDGYGNPEVSIKACNKPEEYVENSDDCNDLRSEDRPGATEICDGYDNDCDGAIDEGCIAPIDNRQNI